MIKYKVLISITIVVSVIATIAFQYNKIESLTEQLSSSVSNEKAFMAENSIIKKENIAFQFRIDQLNYYNDSLLEEMNNVRKELNVKDKNLEQLQYLLSTAAKTDTIVLRDTIFKEPSFQLDTIVGDKWYKLNIGLKYPSTIITSPTFVSEKYIVVSTKKETIDPPKKCWLSRLFQKKHKIVEVEVIEKSPYVENNKQRFIEIIK